MKIKLSVPYGKEEITFELSKENILDYAASVKQEIYPTPEAIVKEALENPIGQKHLHHLAAGCKTVAIIISDYTRPTPTAFLLPYVLEELFQGGISLENITIVSASGLHAPNSEADLERALGQYYGKISVICHDASDNMHLTYLGESTRGTPIYINSSVVNADLKISIGGIEPHHSAGWSGGAKNVLPGVAGRKTILFHHARAHEPGVELGRIKGNPFREDLDEVGVIVGLDFILNVILNDKKQIIAAFTGDLIKAHQTGVETVRKMLTTKTGEHPDIVIVTPGGSPRDLNFWQCEGKALTRIRHVVKHGGVVILVAQGTEGIGNKEFAEILENNSIEEIRQRFEQEEFSVALNKGFRLVQLLDKASLFIVSEGLKKEMFPKLPVEVFRDIDKALNKALNITGKSSKVLVVPKAPAVIIEID